MNIERAAMRGKLAEAKERLERLKLKAGGLCAALRTSLNALLTPIEEMEPAQIAQQADELVMTLAEIAGVRSEISRLERELR